MSLIDPGPIRLAVLDSDSGFVHVLVRRAEAMEARGIRAPGGQARWRPATVLMVERRAARAAQPATMAQAA